MFLPDGEDPDSFVRQQGLEAFQAAIQHATPLAEFLFDHLQQDVDLNTIHGKSRFSKLAQDLLSTMPQGIYKSLLLKRLSEQVAK